MSLGRLRMGGERAWYTLCTCIIFSVNFHLLLHERDPGPAYKSDKFSFGIVRTLGYRDEYSYWKWAKLTGKRQRTFKKGGLLVFRMIKPARSCPSVMKGLRQVLEDQKGCLQWNESKKKSVVTILQNIEPSYFFVRQLMQNKDFGWLLSIPTWLYGNNGIW